MTRLCLAALAALFVLASARAQTPEEKKVTIAYLRSLQTGSGGFLPTRPSPTAGRIDKPSPRATSSGLRALKYFGGEVPDRAACARFVEGCFDRATGGFFDTPPQLKPDVFTTAVGLMAVVELKLPADRYTGPAVKYLGENAKGFEEVRIAAAGLESVQKRPP